MHEIGYKSDGLVHSAFPHGSVLGSVLNSSLVRKAACIPLIPRATTDAILEMCCTVIICTSNMHHMSLQHLGLNYSFKLVEEPRIHPRFCEVFVFGPHEGNG